MLKGTWSIFEIKTELTFWVLRSQSDSSSCSASDLQARERRERKKAEQKELREWERNKEWMDIVHVVHVVSVVSEFGPVLARATAFKRVCLGQTSRWLASLHAKCAAACLEIQPVSSHSKKMPQVITSSENSPMHFLFPAVCAILNCFDRISSTLFFTRSHIPSPINAYCSGLIAVTTQVQEIQSRSHRWQGPAEFCFTRNDSAGAVTHGLSWNVLVLQDWLYTKGHTSRVRSVPYAFNFAWYISWRSGQQISTTSERREWSGWQTAYLRWIVGWAGLLPVRPMIRTQRCLYFYDCCFLRSAKTQMAKPNWTWRTRKSSDQSWTQENRSLEQYELSGSMWI